MIFIGMTGQGKINHLILSTTLSINVAKLPNFNHEELISVLVMPDHGSPQ
jgi:hypothetical protein